MAIIKVIINARDTKDGVPDITYSRKLNVKSIQDGTLMAMDELKTALPKCEILDIEARVVATN